MVLSAESFKYLVDVIKKESGIVLTEDKEYLIESRLLPVAKRKELETIDALVEHVRISTSSEELTEIIEAVTTNESFFFRDSKPFDCLKKVIIPDLLKRPTGEIKIWSSACSTGQEPYSIAMTLVEMFKSVGEFSFKILATDIDHTVLGKAQRGEFSQFEVQRGMPINLLLKYFSQNEENWVVKDELKQYVSFEDHNLICFNDYAFAFDIIFCRNVLIYFDIETKSKVLQKLCNSLNPHGYLLLGSSESTVGIETSLQKHEDFGGVYQLNN